MTNIEIVQLILGSGGILGFIILIFRMGRIIEKIGNMSDKIDTISTKIDECNKRLGETNDRLTRLEVRVEERTLKVYHVERNGTEVGSYRG